jgi:hypothetical protein
MMKTKTMYVTETEGTRFAETRPKNKAKYAEKSARNSVALGELKRIGVTEGWPEGTFETWWMREYPELIDPVEARVGVTKQVEVPVGMTPREYRILKFDSEGSSDGMRKGSDYGKGVA